MILLAEFSPPKTTPRDFMGNIRTENLEKDEIRSLTGLRGFAALWVFSLHATWGSEGGFFTQIARQGSLGVIIFFVLSGYILSFVYAEKFRSKQIGYFRFLQARFARIYPLHFSMLLFLLALTVFGLVKMPAKNNFYSFLLNLGLLQSWGFINPITWNEPAWSISTEFFAYLLFPFLILKVYRKSETVLLFSAVVAVSWIFFNPYFHMLRSFEGFGWVDLSGIQFNYGNSLLWCFFVFVSGMILFCTKDTAARRINTPYFFDACTLIGLAVLFYVSCNAAAMPKRDQIAAVAAILIVFGLSRDAGIGRLVFGNNISLFLGRISYSLYLSHEWVRYTAIQFIHPLPLWLNLVLALSVATLLHFFLERPARQFLRKKWTRKTIPLSNIQADTREA